MNFHRNQFGSINFGEFYQQIQVLRLINSPNSLNLSHFNSSYTVMQFIFAIFVIKSWDDRCVYVLVAESMHCPYRSRQGYRLWEL